MASSWTPSSPRPTFRPASCNPTADVSAKNYAWYKEQFERVIVGYLKDKNEEQLANRARAAISKLSEDNARDGRFACWTIIQAVMNNLVKGAPAIPHVIAFGRYVAKRHRIEEILSISNSREFLRRLYRIVPMDQHRNNDFEFEHLLWREGLGSQPASTGLGISRTRATDGYANAPNQPPFPAQPKMIDKHTSTKGVRSVNTPAALVAAVNPAGPSRASSVDLRPNFNSLLKRPSVTIGEPSAKRQCRSEKDGNRLSPIQQEMDGPTPHSTGEGIHGMQNVSETLSAHFTKLLEDQQKQNAKQSIRIAQLEDKLQESEKIVLNKDEALQSYLGLDARVKRLQSAIESRDDELKKSDEIITKQLGVIKRKDEVIKLQKAQRQRATASVVETQNITTCELKSESELRKDDKTARLRSRLRALEERKPELVFKTDAVLESLRAYMALLEQGTGDEPCAMANGNPEEHNNDNDSARVLEDGEIIPDSC